MKAERASRLVGIVAVAATYVSFLLHAQFAFLALVSREMGEGAHVQRVMAAMGLAGLAASLATGALLRIVPGRRAMLVGFAGCAGAALASVACRTPLQLGIVATLVGAFTGLLTVAVATNVRALIPGPRTGLGVGIATGAAYLTCNVPAIFHGGPVLQSIVAAAACLLAAAALALRGPALPAGREPSPPPGRGLFAFSTLVAEFLALVWLDSAAFRIVQEASDLRGATWAPGARTLLQGIVHLLAAIGAGLLVDRGRMRSLLLGTFASFTVAFALLGTGGALLGLAGPLYAAGISTYSTALVLAPTHAASACALQPRRRAAILYAVAGWLGSALGVGMAQDLHRIPGAFTACAGLVLVGGIVLADGASARGALHAVAPALALAAAGVAVALGLPAHGVEAGAVARGRRAYVAEGCIHCHSQYVRPGLPGDEAPWGPSRADQLEERPPLLGTRRLGPDLLDVGNRRDATWQRLHLRDPRALVPTSRMPSYAHLFAPGDSRGEDLVAYLTSLGSATVARRLEATRRQPMPRGGEPADLEAGVRLFAASCAPCHGPAGRGDGPLAAQAGSPFLDLAMPGLPRVERVTGDDAQDLARLIRHGSFGTAMAGHELLTDADLRALVARVEALRAEAGAR